MDYNYEIDLVEGKEGDVPTYIESFERLERALDKAISIIEKGENGWHCVILSCISGATLFTIVPLYGMAVIRTEGEVT